MLVNKTPHDIVIVLQDGERITIKPEPSPARVDVTTIPYDVIDNVPLVETVYGQVENLPDPEAGVWYIVSGVVISACPHRYDLVRPDTANAVRDEDGRIIGVPALTW
jgi:hypothetical protein